MRKCSGSKILDGVKRQFSVLRLLLVFVVMLLVSCSGKDGTSYQKFWWAGSLGYLYDTNPASGSYIRNDVYFQTGEGTFYVQYQAFDGSQWYAYYTITINKGKPILQDGDNLWFELDLYSFGPSLYKWTSARAVGTEGGPAKVAESSMAGSQGIRPTQSSVEARNLGPIIGTETYSTVSGTVTLKYGRFLGQ